MPALFQDRTEAGRRLAAALAHHSGDPDVRVLALPRGGVPVAYEVARALHAPLDVFIVRKLGLPGHEEFAMGAIASGGVSLVNEEVVRHFRVSDAEVERVIEDERRELERRERHYRGDRPLPELSGHVVILVDDGLATGATMRAAIAALRQELPARLVVAVPVAAADTCDELRAEVDEVVCLATPEPFRAVGLWYADFSQTTDEEVHALLDRAAGRPPAAPGGGPGGGEVREVRVESGGVVLDGTLTVPAGAVGVVLFAHGSGSSRHSPRNRRVARVLNDGGLATLLLDLLTADEEAVDERTRSHRFDIELLARRLGGAVGWLAARPETRELPVGLFGASTGGGAALVTAARHPDRVRAVVSRGGRPDLAGAALSHVRAPTLLIVGGRDEVVIELNELAMEVMTADVRLEVVAGATHLFEEPGALDEVARLAREWLTAHLATR
ncbi:MAG TPA: alpha/beta family hydrolase [Gemmatimonadales bacterium]